MKLYSLILTDTELSYDNHSDDFFIGIFAERQQADETAHYYLENVAGFNEYTCTYRIVPKEIKDNADDFIPLYVWIVQGWNVNDDWDEIDIVESECFLTKEHAEDEMQTMKKIVTRTEWNIDRWTVGQCEWIEGFVRDN
jgi:hypothetical protein